MYMYSYILEFEFFLLNSLLFNAHNYVTYLSRIWESRLQMQHSFLFLFK